MNLFRTMELAAFIRTSCIKWCLLPVLSFLLLVFQTCCLQAASPLPISPSHSVLDSLLNILKHQTEDSLKVNTLLLAGQEYLQKSDYAEAELMATEARNLASTLPYKKGLGDGLNLMGSLNAQKGAYDKSLDFHIQALKIRRELGDKKSIAVSLNNIGNVHYSQANYKMAVENYTEALQIREEIGDKKGISASELNLANVYKYQGDYPRALELYFKSLKLKEEIGDQKGLPNLLINIGTIFSDQSDSVQALGYYRKALAIAKSTGNKKEITHSLNNIANIYATSGNLPLAIENYQECLHMREEAKDKSGIAVCLSNLARIYWSQGNDAKAMEFFKQSLALKEGLGDKQGIAASLLGLSDIWQKQKKLKEAATCSERALQLAKEIGSPELVRDAEKSLSLIALANQDDLGALKHYKAYVIVRDSILNEESAKKSVQVEMNFAFEKEKAIEKEANEKNEGIALAEKHRGKIQLLSLIIALILVSGFSVFAVYNYRLKRRINIQLDLQNQQVEEAYKVIESKNREITDSISYAKHIQQSLLPKKPAIQKILPKSFILYLPKDIVSGDFYFFKNSGQTTTDSSPLVSTNIVIAAADCTGHGVPGAFMSMIGIEKLNETLTHEKRAGEILASLNRGIKSSLRQDNSENSTRDGMDIALCCLNTLTLQLQFSGANRPLWIFRNPGRELEEIKATHAAIGGLTGDKQVFGMHEIQLYRGDRIYLMTDGYADQFGGNQGKKLTTKALKELMRNIQHKSMEEQEVHLNTFASTWRANREQIDDILLIGIEV
jgi:tetratricopeptide (TPR) repeat protein/serine phosphatase RsbU (regulator of sigma subunit)